MHGDIPGDELSNFAEWVDEVGGSFAEGDLIEDVDGEWEFEGPSWDEHGDHPPDLIAVDLEVVNAESDRTEIERLVAMGVMRPLGPKESTASFGKLTTKIASSRRGPRGRRTCSLPPRTWLRSTPSWSWL